MFGYGMFNEITRPFNVSYRCFSVSLLPGNERQDVENGGKIIMPPSALDHLTRLNVVYPMLFKLTNTRLNRSTHCGVLEFVADEDKCYIPYWMLSNLMMKEGAIIQIESATLPVATYSKFEPQTCDFLDITNPKAVLENALRNFACLTTGDVIAIRYNDKIYELRVLETRPGPAVSIIECDMDVEFASPVDYIEPVKKRPEPVETEHVDELAPVYTGGSSFVPFTGSGNRLDGKSAGTSSSSNDISKQLKGIPDFDFKIGKLTFVRGNYKNDSVGKGQKGQKGFEAFTGAGCSLRSKSNENI